MITIEPILLDVDVSQEEYNVEFGGDEGVDMGMDTSIQVNVIAEGSLPVGGVAGDIIVKRSSENFDAYWIAPATSAEQDSTLPITAGAVYTEIGNINALLATI